MSLSIIVAVSDNNVIGSNNELPWRLSSDLKRFKSITMGHSIIMGRKTFESLPKLLPGRTTIILTKQRDYKVDGALVASSLDSAIEFAKNDTEAFIIGGSEIYQQAIPLATKLYLTKVHATIDGDTFLPEIDWNQWMVIEEIKIAADEKNQYASTFSVLQRI